MISKTKITLHYINQKNFLEVKGIYLMPPFKNFPIVIKDIPDILHFQCEPWKHKKFWMPASNDRVCTSRPAGKSHKTKKTCHKHVFLAIEKYIFRTR